MNVRSGYALRRVSEILLAMAALDLAAVLFAVVLLALRDDVRTWIMAIPFLGAGVVAFAGMAFLPYCGICLAEIHQHFCDTELALKKPDPRRASEPQEHEDLPADVEDVLLEGSRMLRTARNPSPVDSAADIPNDWLQPQTIIGSASNLPVMDQLPADWPSR